MSDHTVCKEQPTDEKKIVVLPVEWGQLSKDTFLWYVNGLYLDSHFLHVCYVPDFRRHLQPGQSPEEVMNIMIETNTESELLKKLYEDLIAEKKIHGKFVRVGGNNRWCAINEYCKWVGAVLLVLGTQPRPLAANCKKQPDHIPGPQGHQGSTNNGKKPESSHKGVWEKQYFSPKNTQDLRTGQSGLREQENGRERVEIQEGNLQSLQEAENDRKRLQERGNSQESIQVQASSPKSLQEHGNSQNSIQEPKNNQTSIHKPELLLRFCEKNETSQEPRVAPLPSSDAIMREAARKIFLESLVDHGPFPTSVAQDLLDQCVTCSIVVYRPREQKTCYVRRSFSLVQGSFNVKAFKSSEQLKPLDE